jgi:hypothetical protein
MVKMAWLEIIFSNTIIYEKLSIKKNLISKGISNTLEHCEVANVINCDHYEKKNYMRWIHFG